MHSQRLRAKARNTLPSFAHTTSFAPPVRRGSLTLANTLRPIHSGTSRCVSPFLPLSRLLPGPRVWSTQFSSNPKGDQAASFSPLRTAAPEAENSGGKLLPLAALPGHKGDRASPSPGYTNTRSVPKPRAWHAASLRPQSPPCSLRPLHPQPPIARRRLGSQSSCCPASPQLQAASRVAHQP